MKKLFLTSLAAVMTVSAASALELTPYAAARLGYERTVVNDLTAKSAVGTEHMGNIMDNGITMSIAGGSETRVTEMLGIRGEVEYTYSRRNNMTWKQNGDKKPYDSNMNALLLNVYADFHNATAFTPYVTAGAGYAWTNVKQDSKNSDMKIRDHGFAWQVGAGVEYNVTAALSLDLGYRFMMTSDLEKKMTAYNNDGEMITQKLSMSPFMHQIRLGARYAF